MEFISHRGYWKNNKEKNTRIAFERSFKMGFGAEFDLRDLNGRLVVSHGIADAKSLDFIELINIYKMYDTSRFLAINIKSDGLHDLLMKTLEANQIINYFVFDMSIPEGINYLERKVNFFARQSEYELSPVFYEEADGVWMDEFQVHWINSSIIKNHLEAGKKVCLVSPELHNMDYKGIWQEYKELIRLNNYDKLFLCTDIPEEAKVFFYD